MDLGITGKVAMVTAASRGMGRAVARRLASEGARVVISARDVGALEDLAREIIGDGGTAPFVAPADLTDSGQIARAVARAIEAFGGIDILVANSVGPAPGKFEEADDACWYAAFDMAMMSTVRLVRAALPSMRTRFGGSVVAIQSTSVRQPLPHHVLSNAVRPGMPGLMKSLAMEFGRENIRFNTVTPGRVLTDRLLDLESRRLVPGETLDSRLERMGAELPIGRLGHPEEIADAVAWLVSPRASYVTGATIAVDGGNAKGLF